jgi:long-chain acyl-CoA synthetase
MISDFETPNIFKYVSEGCAYETFRHYLFESARNNLGKPAIEWLDTESNKLQSVTYTELCENVICLGTELFKRGYKGKTVALLESRSYEWVLLAVTAMCSDMRVVPIDCNENEEVLKKKLDFCDADLCFDEEHSALVNVENAKFDIVDASNVQDMLRKGREAFHQGDDFWVKDYLSCRDPNVMIFTSGTGGKLKLAVLTQGSFNLEKLVREGLGMDKSKNKCLITLPFFHIAGLIDLRGCLMLGLTAQIGQGLKYLLQEYALAKPEIVFVVPAQATFLYGVLIGKDNETGRELLGGNLKAIRTSGAPLPQNIRDAFKHLDVEVTSDYGMTETSGPVSVSLLREDKIFTKPGSVGHILDCLKVYAENPDENGCGEIVIEGYCLFDGYYKDEEETSKVLKDEKLYTGDVGYVDEDNFLFLVGRKKNIIILSNGENIIPEELEKMVYQIPEVKECLVFAEGDKLAIKVYAEGLDEEETLKEKIFELNKNQPNHKMIRNVYVSSTALPKTKTGKILRKA